MQRSALPLVRWCLNRSQRRRQPKRRDVSQALEADTQAAVVAQGLQQEATGAGPALIGQDGAEGHARVVVDGHVHVLPAGAGGVPLVIPR